MAELMCRSCQLEVEPGDLICPHCRANLTGADAVIDTTMVEPPPPPSPPSEAEPEPEACPGCSAPLPVPDAPVCPACLMQLTGGLLFRFGEAGIGWRHVVPPGASLVLGREGSPAAHALAGYDTVSRQHAQVTVTRNRKATVADLNSTNGTFVDGVRVPPGAAAELGPGSRLRLASNVEITIEPA